MSLSRIVSVLLFSATASVYAGHVRGPVRTVALTGQHAPGFDDAAKFVGVVSGFAIGHHSAYSSFELNPPLINNNGQVAFIALIDEGHGLTRIGLWTDAPGSLQLVVSSGDPMPDVAPTVKLRSFWGLPSFNDRGDVAFEAVAADHADAPPFTSNGIWAGTAGNLRKVVTNTSPPSPTLSGIEFRSFSQPSLNNLGNVAFTAQVVLPGSGPQQDRLTSGVWSDASGVTKAVALEGDPVELHSGQGTIDQVYWQPLIDDSGATTVYSGVRRGGGRAFGAVWNDAGGAIESVVADGDAVSVHGQSSVLFSVERPLAAALNGNLVFDGYFSDHRRGLVVIDGGVPRTVAVSNTIPPGVNDGKRFGAFIHTYSSVNSHGQVAFLGSLENTHYTVNTGIWSEGFGDLSLVARAGGNAPGTELAYAGFGRPIINDAGQFAFTAVLTGNSVTEKNDQGIWAQGPTGIVQLIAREGDHLEVAPGDSRIIAELAFQDEPDVTGSRRVFNDFGQLVFSALFTDGSSGVFVSNRVAIPEPSAVGHAIAGMLTIGVLRIVRKPRNST